MTRSPLRVLPGCPVTLLFLTSLCLVPVGSDDVGSTSRWGAHKESFTEELLVRPLPDGNVMSHVSMRTTWPASRRGKDGGAHYSLFP